MRSAIPARSTGAGLIHWRLQRRDEKDSRKKLADELAERAIKLLTDAGSAGFFKQRALYRQKLTSDPDLHFLRGRPDFKKLTERLKSN